jgi:hypothetical membrane protein
MYALGNYGYIITSGFYAIAAAQLLLAYPLIATQHSAAIYLASAGIGVLLVAVFPASPVPLELVSRLPHTIGALMQFLFFPLAVFSISNRLAAGSFRRYSIFTAYMTAILFIVLLILFVIRTRTGDAVFGLLEKSDILLINLWLIAYAYYMYKGDTTKY